MHKLRGFLTRCFKPLRSFETTLRNVETRAAVASNIKLGCGSKSQKLGVAALNDTWAAKAGEMDSWVAPPDHHKDHTYRHSGNSGDPKPNDVKAWDRIARNP